VGGYSLHFLPVSGIQSEKSRKAGEKNRIRFWLGVCPLTQARVLELGDKIKNMNPKEILRKIEKSKENYSKRVEKEMLDKVSYGAKETLNYFARKLNQGKSSKEILKDIERAKYK